MRLVSNVPMHLKLYRLICRLDTLQVDQDVHIIRKL